MADEQPRDRPTHPWLLTVNDRRLLRAMGIRPDLRNDDELRPDAAWLRETMSGLERAGILRREQVVLTEWCNNEFAYIDQNLEFGARIARVRKWFDSSGYITFGRFGRYEYHNSDQCIARAMQVHQHIEAIARSGAPAPVKLD